MSSYRSPVSLTLLILLRQTSARRVRSVGLQSWKNALPSNADLFSLSSCSFSLASFPLSLGSHILRRSPETVYLDLYKQAILPVLPF
jgi:hypothetical protein